MSNTSISSLGAEAESARLRLESYPGDGSVQIDGSLSVDEFKEFICPDREERERLDGLYKDKAYEEARVTDEAVGLNKSWLAAAALVAIVAGAGLCLAHPTLLEDCLRIFGF